MKHLLICYVLSSWTSDWNVTKTDISLSFRLFGRGNIKKKKWYFKSFAVKVPLRDNIRLHTVTDDIAIFSIFYKVHHNSGSNMGHKAKVLTKRCSFFGPRINVWDLISLQENTVLTFCGLPSKHRRLELHSSKELSHNILSYFGHVQNHL